MSFKKVLNQIKHQVEHCEMPDYTLLRLKHRKRLVIYYLARNKDVGHYSHAYGLYDRKDGVSVFIAYSKNIHAITVRYITTDTFDAELPYIIHP